MLHPALPRNSVSCNHINQELSWQTEFISLSSLHNIRPPLLPEFCSSGIFTCPMYVKKLRRLTMKSATSAARQVTNFLCQWSVVEWPVCQDSLSISGDLSLTVLTAPLLPQNSTELQLLANQVEVLLGSWNVCRMLWIPLMSVNMINAVGKISI